MAGGKKKEEVPFAEEKVMDWRDERGMLCYM